MSNTSASKDDENLEDRIRNLRMDTVEKHCGPAKPKEEGKLDSSSSEKRKIVFEDSQHTNYNKDTLETILSDYCSLLLTEGCEMKALVHIVADYAMRKGTEVKPEELTKKLFRNGKYMQDYFTEKLGDHMNDRKQKEEQTNNSNRDAATPQGHDMLSHKVRLHLELFLKPDSDTQRDDRRSDNDNESVDVTPTTDPKKEQQTITSISELKYGECSFECRVLMLRDWIKEGRPYLNLEVTDGTYLATIFVQGEAYEKFEKVQPHKVYVFEINVKHPKDNYRVYSSEVYLIGRNSSPTEVPPPMTYNYEGKSITELKEENPGYVEYLKGTITSCQRSDQVSNIVLKCEKEVTVLINVFHKHIDSKFSEGQAFFGTGFRAYDPHDRFPIPAGVTIKKYTFNTTKHSITWPHATE